MESFTHEQRERLVKVAEKFVDSFARLVELFADEDNEKEVPHE